MEKEVLNLPEFLQTCLIVCPLVFLAGFVDSVAGGGGLISLPAYLFVGFPAHLASGTNKVVASTGTALATWKYYKSGKIRMKPALLAAVGALIGSVLGTQIALHINSEAFRILLLIALPLVALLITFKKDFGNDQATDAPVCETNKDRIICFLIGIGIGCYDGLIGPGTGTFLIMAFTIFVNMDLLTASGCAKVGNLASNIASAVLWITSGNVMFELIIPAAACSMLGNYLGSQYAIKGGSQKVRGMIYIVLAMLFIKFFYELFLAA